MNKSADFRPQLIVLNQMAGPLTWELVEDLAHAECPVALLTGHPDTLAKGSLTNLCVDRSFTYQRGSMLRRTISWFSYLIHAFVWLWKWPANVPLLVFSNPPMLAWLAALMRRLRGTPFVVMVHDVYPELPIRMNKLRANGLVAKAWRCANRWSYGGANEVLTLGDFMARVVEDQFDASRTSSGRVHVVYPWADTDRIRPLAKSENPFALQHGQQQKLTIMYSGNMGLGHDMETMLETARRIDDDRAHFLFIGAGPKWSMIDSVLRREELSNVTLLSWLAEQQLAHSLATADIALVSLESEVAGLAIPSKAFYLLAAGTPLVVIADTNTELAQIVDRHDCGWVVAPGDVDSLAAIVGEMIERPERLTQLKRNARQAAERIGARRTNSKIFSDLLQPMTQANSVESFV